MPIKQAESYRNRSFIIIDNDARIREPDDLLRSRLDGAGNPVRIPKGTNVSVNEIRTLSDGARKVAVFARTSSIDGTIEFGWTSAINLEGALVSETFGAIEPPSGAGRYSGHAIWTRGEYSGQAVLVRILGSGREMKMIAEATVEPLLAMVAAARQDAVPIALNSAFRSWYEQKELYDGYQRGENGYNLAAKPGYSNHQNGIAFDIDVGGGGSNRTYLWLQRHATRFGFVRTVKSEPWHWEWRQQDAERARLVGTYKTW